MRDESLFCPLKRPPKRSKYLGFTADCTLAVSVSLAQTTTVLGKILAAPLNSSTNRGFLIRLVQAPDL